jgi:release factor glutamine methyltransferase
MRYLLSQDLVAGKMVAELGVGCFALGILAAKHGAKAVVGTDISSEAISCAKVNRAHHGVEQQTALLQGEGLSPLLPRYKGRIDVLLCGAPWDTISASAYAQLPKARQGISKAFYDIDDRLITALLTRAHTLLAPGGKLFVTSAMSKIGRLEKLCATHQVAYTILVEEDIHEDGNMHYILEVSLS